MLSTQKRKGTCLQILVVSNCHVRKFLCGYIIPTTINCCLILPTNPQFLVALSLATNLSFEYAWFLSNFGLNVSKFRIRQTSDYWVEKSQVAVLFYIAVTYIDKLNQLIINQLFNFYFSFSDCSF